MRGGGGGGVRGNPQGEKEKEALKKRLGTFPKRTRSAGGRRAGGLEMKKDSMPFHKKKKCAESAVRRRKRAFER